MSEKMAPVIADSTVKCKQNKHGQYLSKACTPDLSTRYRKANIFVGWKQV
jgi:hypothetical protein